jgi:ribose transport system ATP-binding protein
VAQVNEVSKRFGGVLALDRVSLTLRPGEVHALVGENGAGKSTLIKVLTGAYQPDDGELTFLGEPVTFPHPRDALAAGISAIYQELNLVPMLSVARNLYLGREPLSRLGLIDFRRMHRQARSTLAAHGVTVDVRRPLGEVGIALQQMVAVVRAVSTDARLVIMDEPTSSLEPREVTRLLGMISVLRDRGVAVLYVTHKLDEVFRACQQVTVLRDGRVVHTGPVAGTTRLGLVATMLGRRAEEIRAHGLTRFAHARSGQVSEPVLRAESLTRGQALMDVGLEVHPGEVVGLAGLLGSGRSETARAIFGVDPVDTGSVTVGGRRFTRWRPATVIRAGVGMVSEDRQAEGLIPTLSVRDNIALAALTRLTRAGFVSERMLDEIADTFIRRLRIRVSSRDQLVSELSGGNQQKVLLARMLCLDPRVLILDEPTRGIDVGAKAEIQGLIDALAGDGLGVLLISSELEEIVEGCHTVTVLRDGAVAGVLRGEEISEGAIMTTIATAGPEAE